MKTPAHHQPIYAQSVSEQWFPQFYMLAIVLCVMGYPLGHLRSAVLTLSPSHVLWIPSLLIGGVGRGAEKPLTSC